jgi:hypothetical protein
MTEMVSKIKFYFPEKDLIGSLPDTPEDFFPWMCRVMKGGSYTAGRYVWAIQTYLYLKGCFKCEIVHSMPASGPVLVHASYLDASFKPGRDLFLVCMNADKRYHPYAQMHVTQSPRDGVIALSERFPRFWQAHYIDHWPQPGLKPRKTEGDRFKNIAFIGTPSELAECFRTERFRKDLNEIGLDLSIVAAKDKWNDYTDVDCVFAVRHTDEKVITNRPPSKLINAWLAGVPAVLGPETSFRAKRRSSLDYIEVANYEEALEALKRLKEDTSLRAKMIENGLERGKEYTAEKTAQRWKFLINDIVVPEYEKWLKLPQGRVKEFFKRRERYYETKDITVFDPLPIKLLKHFLKKK